MIVGPVSNAHPRVVGLHLAFLTCATGRRLDDDDEDHDDDVDDVSRRDVEDSTDHAERELSPFFRRGRVYEDTIRLSQRKNPDLPRIPPFSPFAMPTHARSLFLPRYFFLSLSLSLSPYNTRKMAALLYSGDQCLPTRALTRTT